MPSRGSRDAVERLVHAAPGLVAEHSLDLVIQRVVDLGRELLGARQGAVRLLNPDQRTLASYTPTGIEESESPRVGNPPVGDDALSPVIHHGKILRLASPSIALALPGIPPTVTSLVGVPIVSRHGILGDLHFIEKSDPEGFTETDLQVALVMASIIGSAAEHARFHDQQSRLLEEIQGLHRSRERFFAMVNHQLRNSLAAIYGWAEMLVRKKEPKSVPRGAIEILESAEQAVSMVNDLLDLNRLDEDRLRPIVRDVDAVQLVRSALRRLAPIATEKGILFAVPEPGESPVMCRTDLHRAEQILVNVLSNAIKYSPAGSTVQVAVAETGPSVTFTVLDQGRGVPSDAVDRIFDIYYSADSQTEGKHGVGLALSRRLARLMEGDLIAVAQPGGGLFVLTLPAATSLSNPS
jgi:signal transduction histidine kinase